MVDRLRAIQRIHQRALDRVAGEWVTYVDGERSVYCRMVRGQSQFDQTSSDGELRVESRSVDWLIDPDKLVAGGKRIEPRSGAKIIPDAGDGKFSVLPLRNGMAWTPADSRGCRIRIHTDRTGDAP